MNRLHRLISFLIVIVMIFTLSSCKADADVNSNKDNEKVRAIDTVVKQEENVRTRWLLEGVPSYEGGALSLGKYNAGPGLMSDSVSETEEDSFMQTINKTNADEFNQYIKKLTDLGYKKTFENKTENNIYVQFAGGGKLIYAYYIDSLKIARIIDDRSSVSLDEYSYTIEGDGSATIYQYGLYHAGHTKKTMNCGMLYVIKFSDNSVFLVDGGHPYQATDEAAEGLMNFLHEITNTKPGETINVAAWFITHAHNDHLALVSKILHRYHSEINLERMLFNFPSFQTVKGGYTAFTITRLKQIVNTYHSNAIFMKPHTGMKFNLADVNFEVMFTHEDGVDFYNPTVNSIRNFNSMTTLLKLTFDENKVFMLLGDTDTEAEKLITEMYTNEDTFKSDIVQVTHHNFNYLRTLYGWIKPEIALVPNSKGNANTSDNAPKLRDVTKHTGNKNVYYAGSATYGFQVVDGEWKLVYEADVIGGPYDGSAM